MLGTVAGAGISGEWGRPSPCSLGAHMLVSDEYSVSHHAGACKENREGDGPGRVGVTSAWISFSGLTLEEET